MIKKGDTLLCLDYDLSKNEFKTRSYTVLEIEGVTQTRSCGPMYFLRVVDNETGGIMPYCKTICPGSKGVQFFKMFNQAYIMNPTEERVSQTKTQLLAYIFQYHNLNVRYVKKMINN